MSKVPHDLLRPIRTDRFDLVNCNWAEAFKVTDNWRRNVDIMKNMMVTRKSFSTWQWVKYSRVDYKKRFIHAIVDREAKTTVGAHRLQIDRNGSAYLAIVIHAERWHGKGAFEEARAGILDRFSGYDEIVRFSGTVLARNLPSIYNYQKLGFRLIGTAHKSYLNPFSGANDDVIMFEMLTEHWRARRSLDE